MPNPDPTIYLNGEFVLKNTATMSVDERGMLFGDGVYEVLRFYAGRPLAMELHLQRMSQSLSRIELAPPGDFDRLPQIAGDLLEKNSLCDAKIYWQITRGAAPRNPVYPREAPPTVLVLASPIASLDAGAAVPTLSAVLAPDERWANCWIKSLMLLPNVLAANVAHRAGCESAILHRDGRVTEATNANVMIVRNGELWTHPADRWVLNGVTRQLVLQLACEAGLPVREETYDTDRLLAADEVLLTGTTIQVTAVTQVDGQPIGAGVPGPATARLHDALNQHIATQCLSL
jgi:D-alanine transaminase